MSPKHKKKSKSSKKTPKNFRPDTEVRIEILKKLKMWNQTLWGKFPKGVTFADRAKKWQEIVDFVKSISATPEGFDKKILVRSWCRWKSEFIKKMTARKQTGKKPGKAFNDEENLLYDILGGNISHQTKIKVNHLIMSYWFIS